MKLDPVEMRRRNFIRAAGFPVSHASRRHLRRRRTSRRCWTGCSQPPTGRASTHGARQSKQRGKLRGRGLAMYLEWTGAMPTETVDIEVDAQGEVTVFSGTQAMGQGLETTYTQLVDEMLGMPLFKGDDRAGRHRSRQRRRQRRLALGVRRRIGGGRRWPQDVHPRARSSPPRRSRLRPPTSNTATAGFASPAPTARSSPASLPSASRRSVIRVSATQDALDAVVAQRRAGVRGGDRSRDGRGDARAHRQLRRHRPHHQPHASSRARSTAASRRAPARRSTSASLYDAESGQLLTGSLWTTACRAPTSCRR